MFLSRVELGLRAAEREAFWREVRSPYGAHQALWKLFGERPEQRRDFLYRAEETRGRPSFLVLSASAPRLDGAGLWSVETKSFAPSLRVGHRLGFRLRANPVVRRGSAADGERSRGQRHDVVMDLKRRVGAGGDAAARERDLVREAGVAWMEAQSARSGFRIVCAERDVIGADGILERSRAEVPAIVVDGYRQVRILRRGERPITFSTLDFEGVLEVVEPEVFLARVCAGFGPQKAFGCGLMLLRRV